MKLVFLLFVLNSLFFCVSKGAKGNTLTQAIHYTKYKMSDIALDVLEKSDKITKSNENPSSSSSFDNITCLDDASLCSGNLGSCCTYDEIQYHVKPEEFGPFEDIWTCIRSNYTCCPASDGNLRGCPPGHSTCCIWGSSLKTLSFGCCDGECSSKAGWCKEGGVDSGVSSLNAYFATLLYIVFTVIFMNL